MGHHRLKQILLAALFAGWVGAAIAAQVPNPINAPASIGAGHALVSSGTNPQQAADAGDVPCLLNSCAFSASPTAPTVSLSDNSTKVATTAFVKGQGYVTAGTSPVTSVFGRAGAVVATSGDYSFSLISGTLGCSQHPALTGDVTTSGCAATLATVNSNTGIWGDATHVPQFTVNGKGLITAVSSVSITQPTGANPSSTITLSATNGSASTFMRSDAAPSLSQAIAPTWTGAHVFSLASANCNNQVELDNSNATISGGVSHMMNFTQCGGTGFSIPDWPNASVFEGGGVGGITFDAYAGSLNFQILRVTKMKINSSGQSIFSGDMILNASNPFYWGKSTDPGTAASAGYCKEYWVTGTGAGTGKKIAYCGTSTTPQTIIDNVGGGL